VAFFEKKSDKLWVWRSVEYVGNKTIGWYVGDRSSETFIEFFERFKHLDAIFYTDGYKAYREIIPAKQHKIGKKYTFGIEQSNSNVSHYLGRMTRRTKVVSRSVEMLLASLKLCWYINENGSFEEYLKILQTTYS
jgi:insertion element IS1 protein InsB